MLVYVASVGDGLCVSVRSGSATLQIDCGSQDGACVALSGWLRACPHGPDAFLLSHFHVDHYNGLLQAVDGCALRRIGPCNIKEVYYPRLPEFLGRDKFVAYMLTLALATRWTLGSATGVMQYELLQAIKKLNGGGPFTCRPVCAGQNITLDGRYFEVLWPPPSVTTKALKLITRAIEDFEVAMKGDENLKKLYSIVRNEGHFATYLLDGGPGRYNGEPSHAGKRMSPEGNGLSLGNDCALALCSRKPSMGKGHSKSRLSPGVEQALKSFREASNHLCVVLAESQEFLFLGDAESSVIAEILRDLVSRQRTAFQLVIAPHHGTHWHSSLRNLQCDWLVASNGKNLGRRMRVEYDLIARCCLTTRDCGDLVLRA